MKSGLSFLVAARHCEIDELTRKADESMYTAKRSGGGVVCYSN